MRKHTNFDNDTMETGDHFKNGTSTKSQKSKGNFIQMTFLFIAFLCLSVSNVRAQDIIILKNGNEIKALVQEIGDTGIKYKKFENPNGPNYSLNISEIFMIRYENGSKDVFVDTPQPNTSVDPNSLTPTTPTKIQNNMGEVYLSGTKIKYSSNKKKVTNIEDLFYGLPDALNNYRSGKTWSAVGWSFTTAGILLVIYDFDHSTHGFSAIGKDNYDPNGRFSCPLFWTGIGVGIVAGIFHGVGKSKIRTAVDSYNASIKRQQTPYLSYGFTQSGAVGLTLYF